MTNRIESDSPVDPSKLPQPITRLITENNSELPTIASTATPTDNFLGTPVQNNQVVRRPQTAFNFGDNFLLRAVPQTEILTLLDRRVRDGVTLSPIEEQLREDLTNGLSIPVNITLGEILRRVNTPISQIEQNARTLIRPSGVHVPPNANLPANVRQGLENGTITFEQLSPEHRQAITIRLENNDIAPLPAGRRENQRDVQASFNPDGRVFPYTLFPTHAFSNLGVPTAIYTRNENGVTQTVDPNSLRAVYYRDPRTGNVQRGHYFQVNESRGQRGEGGINGAIVPANQPLVIINNRPNGQNSTAYVVQPAN